MHQCDPKGRTFVTYTADTSTFENRNVGQRRPDRFAVALKTGDHKTVSKALLVFET